MFFTFITFSVSEESNIYKNLKDTKNFVNKFIAVDHENYKGETFIYISPIEINDKIMVINGLSIKDISYRINIKDIILNQDEYLHFDIPKKYMWKKGKAAIGKVNYDLTNMIDEHHELQKVELKSWTDKTCDI